MSLIKNNSICTAFQSKNQKSISVSNRIYKDQTELTCKCIYSVVLQHCDTYKLHLR